MGSACHPVRMQAPRKASSHLYKRTKETLPCLLQRGESAFVRLLDPFLSIRTDFPAPIAPLAPRPPPSVYFAAALRPRAPLSMANQA